MKTKVAGNSDFDPLGTPCVPLARAARKLGTTIEFLESLARKGVITLHRTPSGQYELSVSDIARADRQR